MNTLQTLLQWVADRRFMLAVLDARAYRDACRPKYTAGRRPLMLNSGATISLQYSATHYCKGTDTLPENFELWQCPSSPILGEEQPNDPYAYVPLATIVEYIDSLGGIVPLKTQLAIRALEQ